MIIFLLTVSVCLLLLVVGLLLYIGYKVSQLEETQEVIFDAAVSAEERNREIELNQEAILNAYSRQN
jgi:nitric oxide reductase large subunit